MIDCAAYIGQYPFRHLPHPDPDVLVRVLEREGLSGAWVGYLPSAGTAIPRRATMRSSPHSRRIVTCCDPAPVVRPDWPRWERHCAISWTRAPRRSARIRCSGEWRRTMRRFARLRSRAASWRSALLTVRFEDLRQRIRSTSPVISRPRTCVRSRARASGEARGHRRGTRAARGGALGSHARGAAARVLGFRLDLGSAGGSFRASVPRRRRRALRVRHALAASAGTESASQSRSAFRRSRAPWRSPSRGLDRA